MIEYETCHCEVYTYIILCIFFDFFFLCMPVKSKNNGALVPKSWKDWSKMGYKNIHYTINQTNQHCIQIIVTARAFSSPIELRCLIIAICQAKKALGDLLFC